MIDCSQCLRANTMMYLVNMKIVNGMKTMNDIYD